MIAMVQVMEQNKQTKTDSDTKQGDSSRPKDNKWKTAGKIGGPAAGVAGSGVLLKKAYDVAKTPTKGMYDMD